MYTPDLLTMTDGTPVTSSAQWEARRGELLNILAREQYGTFLPPSTASARVMAPPMPACAGHALQETLEVRFDTPQENSLSRCGFSIRRTVRRIRCFCC